MHTRSLAVVVALGAAAVGGYTVARAQAPGEVVFHVTNAVPGEELPFEAHALGADLKRARDVERAVTPATVRVPGREVYAVFRQLGGRGMLRVTVSPRRDHSTQAVSPVSMFVVRGDSAAVTGSGAPLVPGH